MSRNAARSPKPSRWIAIALACAALAILSSCQTVFKTKARKDEIAMREKRRAEAVEKMREEIRAAITMAIERGDIPGAVVLVDWRGETVFHEAFGSAALTPEPVPMRPDHLFDMASVSKAIGTTTAILILRDQGRLSLDDPVSKYLPEFDRPDKKQITIHNCLTHTTGLAPFRLFFKTIEGKQAYLEAIAAEQLAYPTGAERQYSDLGFITLGLIVEKISGQRLSAFTHENIFKPLGMTHTGYNPSEHLERSPKIFTATEYCKWRERMIIGEVHDENAYAIGGDAGHAGLFSRADDLAIFGRMLLAGGALNGVRILKPETVAQLNQCQRPDVSSISGLGWWIRSSLSSTVGFLPSQRSFGHTGFTGTSIWIDPDHRMVVTLLTNAVHPDRAKAVRGPVQREVYGAVVRHLRELTPPRVRTGLDVMEAEGFAPLRGKRVAVVTNHTALDARGDHLIGLLDKAGIDVTAIFGPEHGLLGDADAGEGVADAAHSATPIYSLFGERRKPTPEMGKEFDVMLYDIQDVGARFYTYIWTLFNVQQFCAETGKRLYVLDRPNPLGGVAIEGPMLEEEQASFVGLKPLPIRYGLTVGELARLFNKAGWLGKGLEADLEVVKMEGWRRDMWYDDTGLDWAPPSPNMPSLQAATVYPGTCLFEGVGWSEGRGTRAPFLNVGGPGVDGVALAARLNAIGLAGCHFHPAAFTPGPIEGAVANPKHNGTPCGGVLIRVDDRKAYESVRTGLEILAALRALYPESHQWHKAGFDRLTGTSTVREQMEAGKPVDEIVASWQNDLRRFERLRRKAMLY